MPLNTLKAFEMQLFLFMTLTYRVHGCNQRTDRLGPYSFCSNKAVIIIIIIDIFKVA